MCCSGVWGCRWCTGSYDSSISAHGLGSSDIGQFQHLSVSMLPIVFANSLIRAVMQISKQYTQYGAALLFFIFGFKMLYEVFTIAEKVHAGLTAAVCFDASIQASHLLAGQHAAFTCLHHCIAISLDICCCSHLLLTGIHYTCTSPIACGLAILHVFPFCMVCFLCTWHHVC